GRSAIGTSLCISQPAWRPRQAPLRVRPAKPVESTYEPLRRHQWLFLQGVEGLVLSQDSAGPTDAPLLWRAFSFGGDQQHLQTLTHVVGVESLGESGGRRFQVRAQGVGADHALSASEGCRPFGGGSLSRRRHVEEPF